jgi:hypothetical protein
MLRRAKHSKIEVVAPREEEEELSLFGRLDVVTNFSFI